MGSGSLGCRYTRPIAIRSVRPVRARTVSVLALLLLSACGEEAPRSAAEIEAAVETYLSERTDLRSGQMSVRADRIRYEGDRAVASVSIVASDDPMAAMKMIYELERDSNGWRVVPAAASGHSAGTAPPLKEAPSSLPPGHPPTGPSASGLPPGHPPLTGESK
jgi:hypothetical protein